MKITEKRGGGAGEPRDLPGWNGELERSLPGAVALPWGDLGERVPQHSDKYTLHCNMIPFETVTAEVLRAHS